MRKRIVFILAIVAAAVLLLTSCNELLIEETPAAWNNEASVSDAEHNDFIKTEIVKVIDGDTVKVYLNGKKTTVRIIGINTPESVHPDESLNTEEGKIASDYVKKLLPVGTTVYIEYDLSNKDQYDRTLAYLWLDDNVNTGNYNDFCKYNVSAIIMQNTYCEAVYYRPNKKYYDWLLKLEEEYQR